MKTKTIILIVLIVLLSLPSGFSQCKTFTNWANSRGDLRKLCFYPTTLRMINISKDESFNTMVKDIDKLRLFIADSPQQPVKKTDLASLRSGIKTEDYKDMIQVKQGKQSFYIYMKEKHDKPVGMAGIVYSENSLILIDVEGYISAETINQLITGKVNFGAISKLYDFTKPGNGNKKK